jgi:hypothetical protein
MSTFTPTGNLVRNIKVLMKEQELGQEAVAKAMETLGFSWYRKTVQRVLRRERQVRVDELYGLALVFRTTVAVLLDPATASPKADKEGFALSFRIGSMEPTGVMQFRMLLDIPDDRTEPFKIGVTSWSPDQFVDGVPQWKPWPFDSPTKRLNVIVATSGWENVDDFFSTHPEVESDLLQLIVDHPKPKKRGPMM